ncbi:MAG: hypothetical protein CME06_12205 [Gemmatimonadetes bacterium]|nr:hypothetical protein [Gemmatimonadota bacterium]
MFSHGIARVHCHDCGHDRLGPFSCRGRGFCPSCTGRRMADHAAHLVDHVFPHVPVRQWVLSLPFDAKLRRVVPRTFNGAIYTWLRRKGRQLGVPNPQCVRVGDVRAEVRFRPARKPPLPRPCAGRGVLGCRW